MINIQDIIPFMKDGWVAMDNGGVWNWWEHKPKMKHDFCWWAQTGYLCCLSDGFDIAPADDWTKSLIKVGGNGIKS